MGIPNGDETEGVFKQVKGSVKETVGNAVGNDRLEAEGEVDRAEGNVQETFGKARRKVGEVVQDIGDAIKR